jgi:hypothetical protein
MLRIERNLQSFLAEAANRAVAGDLARVLASAAAGTSMQIAASEGVQ